jgi:hypothetical protein
MPIRPSLARYTPEEIPGAKAVDLVTGVPYSVESIARFSKIPGEYLVTLICFSLEGRTTVSFYVNTDGVFRTIDSQTYACHTLDKDEDIFVPAKSTMDLNLLSTANITGYPIRYLVRVSKTSIIDKLLYGISLSDVDIPLNEKFKLGNRIVSGDIPTYNPALVSRRQISRTITAAGGASTQIGETITVPKNRYIVLDEIAVDGYQSGVTDNYIIIDRDLDDNYVSLNCYALPPFVTGILPNIPLSNPFKMRIPALDKLSIYLENGSPVTNFRIRYKYSTYVLTIPEKILWGVTLTADEVVIAKENDLENKVKAGLI